MTVGSGIIIIIDGLASQNTKDGPVPPNSFCVSGDAPSPLTPIDVPPIVGPLPLVPSPPFTSMCFSSSRTMHRKCWNCGSSIKWLASGAKHSVSVSRSHCEDSGIAGASGVGDGGCGQAEGSGNGSADWAQSGSARAP